MTTDVVLKLIYAANVLVAGWAGSLCLFAPDLAGRTVFSGTATASSAMQVTGALWLSIALLSLAVALPALLAGHRETLPGGMTAFFLAWVVALPLVIPWRGLFEQIRWRRSGKPHIRPTVPASFPAKQQP